MEYREGFTHCSECDVALGDAPPPGPPPPGPQWVVAGGYASEEDARLAQGMLAAVGIPCQVVSRPVRIMPVPHVETGGVVLLVPPDQAAAAELVLERVEAGATALPEEDLDVVMPEVEEVKR